MPRVKTLGLGDPCSVLWHLYDIPVHLAGESYSMWMRYTTSQCATKMYTNPCRNVCCQHTDWELSEMELTLNLIS